MIHVKKTIVTLLIGLILLTILGAISAEERDTLLISNPNVQVIYVDDDYTPSTPGWNEICFATVRDGLDAVPEQGVLYIFNGIYNEYNLDVEKSIILIGESSSGTIIDGSIGSYQDTLTVEADAVKILRIAIKNNKPHASALVVDSGYNIITGTVIENSGYGLLIGGDYGYNTIIRNTFIGSGITFYSGPLSAWNTHRVEKNTVDGKPIYYFKNTKSFQVPPDAGQVILANCSKVLISELHLSDPYRSIQIGFSSNISIENNAIYKEDPSPHDVTSQGITIHQSHDIWLKENSFSGYFFGLFIAYSINCIIKDNSFIKNRIGLYEYQSRKNIITQNLFEGHDDKGVLLSEDTLSIVQNNRLINNLYGIYLLFETNHAEIEGNYLTENEYGIYLTAMCTDNTIRKNTLVNNINGTNLFGFSNTNIISDNAFNNNALGLTITGSKYNQVQRNYFVNNSKCGVKLLSYNSGGSLYLSDFNMLYHNNFINNTLQAYDECLNFWDDGYPSGGNYWSDYLGSDGDGDGIGDSAYNITGAFPPNQDRFPYMYPNGWN